MSPKYDRWNVVPENLKKLVRAELAKIADKETQLFNKGFAFKLNQEGNHITELVQSLSELTQGQLADARRSISPWHVVGGIEGTASHRKNQGAHPHDDEEGLMNNKKTVHARRIHRDYTVK